jgi:hypothetical protein
MIYSLKELLQSNKELSIISYFTEQISSLLGIELKKNKIYQLSFTTDSFIEINSKMIILGIIVISNKTFTFDEEFFIIDALSSTNNDKLIEQSLLLKGINHIHNLKSKNKKIISFVANERIQKEVLEPFGFFNSSDIMIKH